MQLDHRVLTLLQEAVAKAGTITAVAQQLDYSRPSISLALKGRYPGDAGHLAAKIIETFAERVACPHLERELSAGACRDHRTRPLPTGPRASVKHWQACRICPLNPHAQPVAEIRLGDAP